MKFLEGKVFCIERGAFLKIIFNFYSFSKKKRKEETNNYQGFLLHKKGREKNENFMEAILQIAPTL